MLCRQAPGPAVRPISWSKKLFFSASTCVLLFGGVELIWRLANGWQRDWLECHRYHPVLGWCLREGWAGSCAWTAGFARINSQGLRDDRPVGPKAPGEKRLLVLGDSVTFGGRVRTDQTYPYRLEQCLRQAGLPWRVLNAGVAGYDSAQEADWLELFGWNLQPDALAIGFCRNDIFPSDRSPMRSGRSRGGSAVQSAAAELTHGALADWLTEHFIVAHKLQRWLWHIQAHLARMRGKMPSAASASGAPSGWPAVEEPYRRIADSARRQHVPVTVIVFPTLDTLEGRTTDDLSERLWSLGKELGWNVVDLNDAFRADAPNLFCPRDPIHPNAAGCERVAARLFQEMTGQNPKSEKRNPKSGSCFEFRISCFAPAGLGETRD
jgi:lysophospholipase L1-like esterase